MKSAITAVALFMLMCIGNHTHAQELYVWERANLTMTLPFPKTEVEFEEDGDGLFIYKDELEIELLLISKDSVEANFPAPIAGLLNAVIAEFELIVVDSAKNLPFIPLGKYIIAIDTAIFTDSLVVGVFTHPDVHFMIIAVFDCYESPLSESMAMMRSFVFSKKWFKSLHDKISD